MFALTIMHEEDIIISLKYTYVFLVKFKILASELKFVWEQEKSLWTLRIFILRKRLQ